MQQGGHDATKQQAIEELVQRAQGGEDTAFGELYQLFYDKIYRYVYFKTGRSVEAEDITEDVFLRMLESISSFKWKGPPFSSWLFRMAHNLVVDHFRKKGRQKTTPLEDAGRVASVNATDVDGRMDVDLTIQEVYQAMGGLTELQKEVLSYRFAAGFSVNQTAAAMGKKENAVKALQHAAIKKLRSLMSARGIESLDKVGPVLEQAGG